MVVRRSAIVRLTRTSAPVSERASAEPWGRVLIDAQMLRGAAEFRCERPSAGFREAAESTGTRRQHGGGQQLMREIINGIFYVMRSGCPWRLLVLEPHPASIQDCDGGGPLLRASRRIFPFIQRVFPDSGYGGESGHYNIDSTTVRAHVSAAGGKGGPINELLAARGAGSPVKFIVSVMDEAGRSPSTSRQAKRRTAKPMTI